MTDTRDAQGFRALCVACDAEGYSKLPTTRQEALQADLSSVLDRSAAKAGLNRDGWSLQPQGDGELAVVPSSEGDLIVVDSFVRELDACLMALNEPRLPEARLRLRVAMHFGVATHARKGFAGPAPVLVSRLLASKALHEALADATEANLALALSDDLYDDVVRGHLTSLRETDFVAVHIHEEKFEGPAWIRVPGDRTPAAPSGASPKADPAPATDATLRVDSKIAAEEVAGEVIGVDGDLRGVGRRDVEITSDTKADTVTKTGNVTGVKLSFGGRQ